MGLSFGEIMLVVICIMLVFGAGKVPHAMEDLGRGLNAFKKGLRDDND